MYTKITGGKILIIGDLHFSDVHTGRHVNYLANCMKILAHIENMVDEIKPSAVVFLGDLVGVSETNIRSRMVLSKFCQVMQKIESKCPIFAVRGNHDTGNYPDYQFLSDLGFFKTGEICKTDDNKLGYFDYYGREGDEFPEVRFHLMDYGMEHSELELSENDNTSDVVLAHNNFSIRGVTTWYRDENGIELSSLDNLKGVHIVISGHIHNPSPQNFMTDMKCGGSCELFYPGCPTRPSSDQNYENCWVVEFSYDDTTGSTSWNALSWELPSLEETFVTNEKFVEDIDVVEKAKEVARKRALKDILDDIMSCRMGSTDLVAQISAIPQATDEAKEMAVEYLQNAINNKAS